MTKRPSSSTFHGIVKKRQVEVEEHVEIRYLGWDATTTTTTTTTTITLDQEVVIKEAMSKDEKSVYNTQTDKLRLISELERKDSGTDSELFEEDFMEDDEDESYECSQSSNCSSLDLQEEEEDKVISQCWKHPVGRTCTAIVVHINHYVKSEHCHIPGELSLAAFNVQNGLVNSMCTVIDPGSDKDFYGHSVNAFYNKDRCGLSHPPFSTEKQNYTKILGMIQSFLRKHRATGTDKNIMFTLKENIAGVKAAIEWLIQRAGDTTGDSYAFPYEVYPLERLLMALSACGLDCAAERHDQNVYSVHDTLQSVIDSCDDLSRMGITTSVQDIVPLSGLDLMLQKSYTCLGEENCTRIASLRMEKHVNAALGVFITEDQVSAYFDSLEYAHLEELACNYHKNPKDEYASSRMIFCALSVAKRLVYLALDVILVNYGVVPVRGKHFPRGASLKSRNRSCSAAKV